MLSVGVILTRYAARAMHDSHRQAIVGGSTSDPERYPYYVRLEYDGDFGCGGSLVHSDFVLTAAHCVPVSDLGIMKAIVGGHNYTSGIARDVTKTIPHLAYDDFLSVSNDIALLKVTPGGAFYADWWHQFRRCDWLRESGRVSFYCNESNEAWVNCPLTCHSCTYEADDDYMVDWTNYDKSSSPAMAIAFFVVTLILCFTV